MNSDEPGYIQAWKKGCYRKRFQQAAENPSIVHAMPRKCRVNRQAVKKAFAGQQIRQWFTDTMPIWGEEAPLVVDRVRNHFLLPLQFEVPISARILKSAIRAWGKRFQIWSWPT